MASVGNRPEAEEARSRAHDLDLEARFIVEMVANGRSAPDVPSDAIERWSQLVGISTVGIPDRTDGDWTWAAKLNADAFREFPGSTLLKILGPVQAHWHTDDGEHAHVLRGRRLFVTSDTTLSWSDLDGHVRNGQTLLVVESTREAFAPLRPRLDAFARAAGMSATELDAAEIPTTPTREHRYVGSADIAFRLAPLRTVSWTPHVSDVTRLLQDLIRIHGGPDVDVSLRDAAADPISSEELWWSKVRDELVANPSEQLHELELVIQLRKPEQDAGLRDFVRDLHEAERTAPRGFVGFKVFRDKLLMRGQPMARRRSTIERAISEGVAHTASIVDPSTNAMIVTIALNREHPSIRELMKAASGDMPAQVDLRGVLLSEAIFAARGTGK